MKIHELQQGTPAWKAVRLGKVTASMFATAKGNSDTRNKYLADLVKERLTGEPRQNIVTACMQNGTDLEPAARAEYEKQEDVTVTQVGFVELNEYVGCSPDGLVSNDGMIEIKCPLLTTHTKTLAAQKEPSTYKAQIQGSLWVTDRKYCDFVSYCPESSKPLFIKRVYRDETYIKELKTRIYMFVADLKEAFQKAEATKPEPKGNEMQVTGTVQNIQPTQQGGYNGSHGYIYTYDMIVMGPAGQVNGEIGSKSSPYPKNIGDPITVEVTQGEYGNKFKNINPQFAQQPPQQGQQPPPQQQRPPQQQSYTPPPQTPPQAAQGNTIQDNIQFAQALNLACSDLRAELIDEPGMEARHRTYLTILQSKRFPVSMSSTAMPFDSPPPSGAPNAQPQGQDDDIPF